MEQFTQWEPRLRRVLNVMAWMSLAIGVFVSFFVQETSSEVIAAAVLAGTYVIAQQMLPGSALSRGWVQDLLVTIGVLVTMTAAALTGGQDSPYVLLSLMPVLAAGTLGGFRPALAAAALGVAALTIISFETKSFELSTFLEWAALIVLVAVTSAQVRRLVLEARNREERLTEVTREATARIDRLRSANRLLARFVEEADAAELNPVTVGDGLLEELTDLMHLEGGVVALTGASGPIVVARAGHQTDTTRATTLPLAVGDRQVGFVTVFTIDDLSDRQLTLAKETIEPVSLAFANILLLQDIAQRAVREERHRLARDLHDEIGPSLASLGLAVDLALLRHPADPDLADHLHQLRESVTGIVEDVRSTVADLRMSPQPSLQEVVSRIAGDVPRGGPAIDNRLRERRPPRPSIAGELAGIIAEALRNAINHASATSIVVHGSSDFDEGRVTVFDDGRGFERSAVPKGRFGLVGMEERAERIGAALNISSTSRGTTVTVAWGPE
ncbi:MAG: histidine kinase [Acidimicrobiia bacterium]